MGSTILTPYASKSKCAFGAVSSYRMAARRSFFNLCLRLLGFLLLLGFVGSRAAAAEVHLRNIPVVSAGPGLTFAIADFDGDHRPDMATVQAKTGTASLADYQIQLRLSSFGLQFIHVLAPSGGLFIETRDVNGDGSIDLEVLTAWRRQPVSIILNKGRGSFSQVDPGLYAGAFSQPKAAFGKERTLARGTRDVVPGSRGETSLEAGSLLQTPARLEAIRASQIGILSHSLFLVSHAGRAPPFLYFSF